MDTASIDAAASLCIECGACTRVQDEGCGCEIGAWGQFAKRIAFEAARNEFTPQTERQLFTCAMCGACTTHCPVGIDGFTVASEGRRAYFQVYPQAAQRWRPMHVDLAGNSLASIRAWRGVYFDDALTTDTGTCESLFFAGCTLTAYAPELTHACLDYLMQAGAVDGMTALCCGNPLTLIGLTSRYETYVRSLNERLADRGVKRIVSGCPNCHYAILHAQELGFIDAEIEVRVLPQVLLETGARIPAERTVAADSRTFSVHDSCPDRFDGAFGSAVRALLGPESCREMKHHGLDSLCCGSGGIVSLYDVSVCKERRAQRMAEFADCGADCLITACTSCTNSMLRSNPSANAHHYLELLFGIEIDWNALRRASAEFADSGGYEFSGAEDNEPILPRKGGAGL